MKLTTFLTMLKTFSSVKRSVDPKMVVAELQAQGHISIDESNKHTVTYHETQNGW